MTSQLSAYLSFRGEAREAMEFYRGVFGGELAMNTFAEFGQTGPGADQIMHAQLDTPAGYTFMGSDVPSDMDPGKGQRVTLMLHGDDEAQLRGYWDGLAEGGSVGTELARQMWGDTYGQLTDKFGIVWSMNISAAQE
jgi:PhnB protein